MLLLFRIIAILEGISYLLLFAFGMPLKYWAGIREPNIYIGYVHGILFIGYVALAVLLTWQRSWSLRQFGMLFLASLLPFGTFYIEEKYLRAQQLTR
jgi:integral membrane protein